MANKKAVADAGPSTSLVPSDFLDLEGLVGKLKDAADHFSEYLRGRFSQQTRKMLDDFDGSKRATNRLKEALAGEINGVLPDSAMYDTKRFAHVELSEPARALLATRPQGSELRRLNWMLVEEAYPYEILRNVSTVPKVHVERVQTGARMEKRMVKVLKALGELEDMSLGEVMEEIVLHAFEGTSTFDSPESQERVAALRKVYGMDYDAHASYRFKERAAG